MYQIKSNELKASAGCPVIWVSVESVEDDDSNIYCLLPGHLP